MPLIVHPNGRFLIHSDGTPFFYLGDTSWELLHRLNREETEYYLQNRVAKGFNVIQTVILAERDGLRTPNAYGHTPLIDHDPVKPDEDYFKHVDWVINRANELGLIVGLLPTWGDKWNQGSGAGPEVFTTDNAHAFGRYVSDRYADNDIVWILGGDRTPETQGHKDIINAMARGLRAGKAGNKLISFHPGGPYPYSNTFHNEDWLDFNMFQSSHIGRDKDNYRMIQKDYLLEPPKPCMEDESCYEEHLIMQPGWKPPATDEYYDDHNVRKAAYWSVFAGGHGYCYGASTVWQFWDPIVHGAKKGLITPWREALDLPGAGQMRHLKDLMLRYPFHTRIPDQSMIASGANTGADHIQATRDSGGTYALVYIPNHQRVTLNASALIGDRLRMKWYDPRTGETRNDGALVNTDPLVIETPLHGPDWVLILEAE